MSYPTIPSLLHAAAVFLNEKAAAGLYADAPLAFRVRVVAHMLEAAAAEVEHGSAVAAGRREALAKLLQTDGELPALEEALCRKLSEGPPLDPEEDQRVRGHLMDALRAELRLFSPRFDTRLHPEVKPSRG